MFAARLWSHLRLVASDRERSQAFAGARCAVPLQYVLRGACRMGCVWCRCAVGIGEVPLVWVACSVAVPLGFVWCVWCRRVLGICGGASCWVRVVTLRRGDLWGATRRVISSVLYVASCDVMSCHVASCHIMPCRRVASCHVMSPCVVSCDVMSCRVMSCHVLSLTRVDKSR